MPEADRKTKPILHWSSHHFLELKNPLCVMRPINIDTQAIFVCGFFSLVSDTCTHKSCHFKICSDYDCIYANTYFFWFIGLEHHCFIGSSILLQGNFTDAFKYINKSIILKWLNCSEVAHCWPLDNHVRV